MDCRAETGIKPPGIKEPNVNPMPSGVGWDSPDQPLGAPSVPPALVERRPPPPSQEGGKPARAREPQVPMRAFGAPMSEIRESIRTAEGVIPLPSFRVFLTLPR